MVKTLRKLARYRFDCGNYKEARSLLTEYIALFASPPATADKEDEDDLLVAGSSKQQQQNIKDVGDSNMYYLKTVDDSMLQVLWGRLTCEILVEDWESASVAVDAVRNAVESLVQQDKMTPLAALQQRTWLLHWSLFVYWNDSASGSLEQMVVLFHSERYKQAITTNAPHLVRYLTAAVFLCKRRVTPHASSNDEARRLLKNLVNVLQDVDYTDPIVEFVHCMSVKFDFDSAQMKLKECEGVLKSDFFLCKQTDFFMEEARIFVFENYCRIHHTIDIQQVGQTLAMPADQAEKWMVNLIRTAQLDACFLPEKSVVVMGSSHTVSAYDHIIDRTRDWNSRSATMERNLSQMMIDLKKERLKRERAAREEE